MVSKPPNPCVTMGNTMGAGVSSLPNYDGMLLEEEWNELFRNSREFKNFEVFSSDELEEMKAENISENTRIRWTKEANKIVMRYFYQSDPTKRGHRKQIMRIWREIGVSDVTKQRLADQTRVIRTNGWLSKVELDEIQRKIKEEENREELRVELQNTCDQQRLPQDEDDSELTNIESLFNRLQDQGLMNDEL